MNTKPEVSIIMGSDSDLPVMKEAAKFLDDLGISYELTIVSAHRTPEKLFEYSQNAHTRGIKVVIAGAGGAAHLPGMVAAITPLPVIGVPIKSRALNGLDSLLSIVQMPGGIPVSTVAINGALNAGILSASILGTGNPEILEKVSSYKKTLKEVVEKKASSLEELGYSAYLEKNM